MQIQENFSLKPFNTFGIEAKARFFAEINTLEDLQELAKTHLQSKPFLILGGGSNILFCQDYPGIVVKMNIKGLHITEHNDDILLEAYAGENWHDTVIYSIQKGFNGLENLSLIPGTVGASPIQNIGAYGVELKDVFENLEAFHIESGDIVTFNKEECDFDYRYSIFKGPEKGKYIVLKVRLRISKDQQFNTEYGALQTLLKTLPNPLTAQKISDAVIAVRQSKLPDPDIMGNAGSFFKNPHVPAIQFETLRAQYPDMPGYSITNTTMKVPAGWLIEKAGWKGVRKGNVGVHQHQALVLVNYGGASGKEIVELSLKIQSSVQEMFNIMLEPEVTFV